MQLIRKDPDDGTSNYRFVVRRTSDSISHNDNDNNKPKKKPRLKKSKSRLKMDSETSKMTSSDSPPVFVRRMNDLAVKVGTRTKLLVEIQSPTAVNVSILYNNMNIRTYKGATHEAKSPFCV